MLLKRREFLIGGTAMVVLPFCGNVTVTPEVETPAPDGGPPIAADDAGFDAGPSIDAGTELADSGPVGEDAGPTPQCLETEDNILGPFYRDGAPFRAVLDESGTMTIAGTVRGPDCSPLAGALLDVWHADGQGAYDNTSPDFLWRGRLYADASGAYSFRSVLPGRYLNGNTYRPRHIHLKVSAPGHVALTTQLYFKGDPYLASDPFVRPSLVIELPESGGSWSGTFHITLARS